MNVKYFFKREKVGNGTRQEVRDIEALMNKIRTLEDLSRGVDVICVLKDTVWKVKGVYRE